MKKISELLEEYFRKHFHSYIFEQKSKRNPYVLMNCPLVMYEDLFEGLTANGEEVFQVSDNGQSEKIGGGLYIDTTGIGDVDKKGDFLD